MDEVISRLSRPMGRIAFPLLLLAALAIVYYAPVEKVQGPIQKVMYLHVSAALISYVAFVVTALASALYLHQRRSSWDRIARSSAELGLILCGIVLITGPLWGRPVWGVFWTWDARLTSTVLLFLIYMTYLVVRQVAPGEQGMRFAAIVGIFGVLDIPFINIAAEKFRTLHPPNVMKGGMTAEMGATLVFCICVMLIFYVYLLARRLETALLEDRLELLRLQTMDH